MDFLQELLSTQGGIALLLLLSPTIALAIFGFLWFKSMQKTTGMKHTSTATVSAIGQGLVLREEYDSMLSSMRKEQRLIAAALYEVSERLARIEERQEMQAERRINKERRK